MEVKVAAERDLSEQILTGIHEKQSGSGKYTEAVNET